jgi:hypothetical protein
MNASACARSACDLSQSAATTGHSSAPTKAAVAPEICKLNDVDPQAWLADVLPRLPDHPARRIDRTVTIDVVPLAVSVSGLSQIPEALAANPARSAIIDGEGVYCDEAAVSVFDKPHSRANDDWVILNTFDLLELDGIDRRPNRLVVRKGLLRRCLPSSRSGFSSMSI